MSKEHEEDLRDTLITVDDSGQHKQKKRRNTLIVALLAVVLVGAAVAVLVIKLGNNAEDLPGLTSIKMPLLDQVTLMKLGTSRVLDLMFFSGNDDRTSSQFQTVKEKSVLWTTAPEGVVSVDRYGRMDALAIGKATVKVISLYNPEITAEHQIEVVANNKMRSNQSRVVNFQGQPRKVHQNYQKIVDRYNKTDVAASTTIPDSIKEVSANPANSSKKT